MKDPLIGIIDLIIGKLFLFLLISFMVFIASIILILIVFKLSGLAEKLGLDGSQIVIIAGVIAGVIGFIIVVLWKEKEQPNIF